MSERPRRTSELVQALGLLATVAAAVLTVTVPEARRFLGLDPSHERAREEHAGSPSQNLTDTTAGFFTDAVTPPPAPVGPDTMAVVTNEPMVDVEPVEVHQVTTTVETTPVSP